MSGKIAIVGAGPAGCYTAQALLKAAPDCTVDVIDALPVPYGLLRYGVAADHQGTKAVARQFERVFTRQGARFFGNLRIGERISLAQLRAAYDAVVLATGLDVDRRLGIVGDDLDGVIGSGALTRALNDHPGAAALPDLGAHPVIIGHGNVALDILRLLVKTSAELEGSDLGAAASDWLAGQRLARITVLGRGPLESARFDPVMIRELAGLSRADLRLRHAGGDAPDTPLRMALHEAVAATSGAMPVTLQFASTPCAIKTDASGMWLHLDGPDGPEALPCSSVITAIGFVGAPPYDPERSAEDDALCLAPGLYHAGWCRGAGAWGDPALARRGTAAGAADPAGTASRSPRGSVAPFLPICPIWLTSRAGSASMHRNAPSPRRIAAAAKSPLGRSCSAPPHFRTPDL